jgi:hypothetical protein
LREVAQALDPAPSCGAPSALSTVQDAAPAAEGSSAPQMMSDDLVRGTSGADSCRRTA